MEIMRKSEREEELEKEIEEEKEREVERESRRERGRERRSDTVIVFIHFFFLILQLHSSSSCLYSKYQNSQFSPFSYPRPECFCPP